MYVGQVFILDIGPLFRQKVKVNSYSAVAITFSLVMSSISCIKSEMYICYKGWSRTGSGAEAEGPYVQRYAL